jgi:hypothetical protein
VIVCEERGVTMCGNQDNRSDDMLDNTGSGRKCDERTEGETFEIDFFENESKIMLWYVIPGYDIFPVFCTPRQALRALGAR